MWKAHSSCVGVQPASGDRERFDDEPRVAIGEDPRLGIEPLAEPGRVGIDVVERSTHEHRPTLSVRSVGAVDLEGDLHRFVLDDVPGSGP